MVQSTILPASVVPDIPSGTYEPGVVVGGLLTMLFSPSSFAGMLNEVSVLGPIGKKTPLSIHLFNERPSVFENGSVFSPSPEDIAKRFAILSVVSRNYVVEDHGVIATLSNTGKAFKALDGAVYVYIVPSMSVTYPDDNPLTFASSALIGSAFDVTVVEGDGVTWFEPQVPPEISESLNDEFDSETLSEEWSWSLEPDSISLNEPSGWLIATLDGAKTCELRRDFVPGADTEFGIEVMLSSSGYEEGDSVGVALLTSGDAKIADFSRSNSVVRPTLASSSPNSPLFNESGDELFVNGGAEVAIGSEWTLNTMERSGTAPKSGSYCIRGVSTTPTGTPYARTATQTITVPELGVYIFKASLRGPHTTGDYGANGRSRAKLEGAGNGVLWDSGIVSGTGYTDFLVSLVPTVAENLTLTFTTWNAGGLPGWTTMTGAIDDVSMALGISKAAPDLNQIWLRLHRSASNIYTYYYSTDGVTWRKVYISNAISTAVAKLALTFSQTASNQKSFGASYVRRYV